MSMCISATDASSVVLGLIKSPPPMWWGRLIVFAESARFLPSLENPYSDYFQIFAVCILALGNLPFAGRELKRFWCDSDNENFDFFTF